MLKGKQDIIVIITDSNESRSLQLRISLIYLLYELANFENIEFGISQKKHYCFVNIKTPNVQDLIDTHREFFEKYSH